MRKRLIALIAGLLYPLAFAPYDLWPLVLVSIALFHHALRDSHGKQAAIIGFCYGLGLFGFGVSWLYVSIHTYGYTPVWLAVPLTALFCATLALYFAVLGGLSAVLQHRLLAFAGLWLLLDWLRGWLLTGFPWLFPGYAMIDTPLARLAPVGGIWLVSLATLLSALVPASLRQRPLHWPVPILAALMWAGGVLVSPALWVSPVDDSRVPVSLVQGDIPQDIKWLTTQQRATRHIYMDLTRRTADGALVIWPESAITEFYQDARPFLEASGDGVRARGGALVTGIPWRVGSGADYRFYNSIAVVSGGVGGYHKQKLVPFGEYVPLESVIRGLIPFFDLPMSSFSKGAPTQDNLHALGMTISPFICYEVLYPELVAERSHGADLLLTVSNDAWFGTSIGPWQHFQMTRMRALETGRWLVRGTNNGITAVIDNHGQVREQLPQFQRDVLNASVQRMQGTTPFMITGGAPIWLLATLFCLSALAQRRRDATIRGTTRRTTQTEPGPMADFRKLTDTLSVAPQLRLEDLEAARDAGFRTIINNRPDREEPGQPGSAEMAQKAQELGLNYFHQPVVSGDITDQNVDDFAALLAKAEGPTLAFCRSGTRCTFLWALSQAPHEDLGVLANAAANAGYDIRGLASRLRHRQQQ